MRKLNRKWRVVPLVMLLGLIGFQGQALAQVDYGQAVIREVQADDLGSRTISLPLRFRDFNDGHVQVTVEVIDQSRGTWSYRIMNTYLNQNGKGRVLVTGLRPSTLYKIRAKLMRSDDGYAVGDPSDWSDYKYYSTKPAGMVVFPSDYVAPRVNSSTTPNSSDNSGSSSSSGSSNDSSSSNSTTPDNSATPNQ